MTLLSSVLGVTRIMGWLLLHFLWQGVLVGLAYKVVKAMFPRGEPRYRLGVTALIAMALFPVLTAWHILNAAQDVATIGPDAFANVIQDQQTLALTPPASALEALCPWMVLAWSYGVLFLCVRAWRQWRSVKALVRLAVTLPAWELKANEMAKRFGVSQSLKVLCSEWITTPVLVGWIRPVVVLPMAVVCNFPAAQIELIFAHELAHLRRWDPLINLFQIALETLHFYHPVVHWISGDVRKEREICCDATGLAIGGGSHREFAETLARLGSLSEKQTPFLLAAGGGELLDRVQLIIMPSYGLANAKFSARLIAVIASGMLIAFTLCIQRLQTPAHRGLTESVQSVGSTLVLPILPIMQSIKVTSWIDLAPTHVEVLKLAKAASNVDGKTKLLAVAASKQQIASTDFSPVLLHVTDLANKIEQPSLQISDSSRAGNWLPKPVAVRFQRPEYPQAALMSGIEGRVVIEFSIGTDGSVKNMRVVSAAPVGVFDQSALQAMRGWKYAAGSAGRFQQTMAFTLSEASAKKASSNGLVKRAIAAQIGCQVPTGTHICRLPENERTIDAEAISSLGDLH